MGGEYASALQSFKEFNDEIGAMEKDKQTAMIEGYSWKQIKSELQKEAHLVKQIMHELDFFSCAQSFGPQISEEPIDLFSKQNKSQKSIQDRYESRNPRKKSMRKQQHKSSRNRMRK